MEFLRGYFSTRLSDAILSYFIRVADSRETSPSRIVARKMDTQNSKKLVKDFYENSFMFYISEEVSSVSICLTPRQQVSLEQREILAKLLNICSERPTFKFVARAAPPSGSVPGKPRRIVSAGLQTKCDRENASEQNEANDSAVREDGGFVQAPLCKP